MARSLIKLILYRIGFDALAALAQTIHDGFVAQVADYATPNPAMPAFKSHIDDLTAAIAAWGPKGARGSHAQHVALVNAANVVKDDLRQLADYAQNQQPDNPTSWGLVGFAIKAPRSKPVALGMVQNLRNLLSTSVVAGTARLRWKRPLGTKAGDVKGYIIQRSSTNVQPQIDGHAIINVVGVVPNTEYTANLSDYTGSGYFWVTPFNSVGFGVTADPVIIAAAPAV